MDASFWINKWESQEIGFHLDKPHPLLEKFYSTVYSPVDGIFVPLCGMTEDLAFFSAKGNPTIGCELSLKAVETYFKHQKLQPEIVSSASFSCFHAENTQILVGDFFNLSRQQMSGFHKVYDRAALVALPKSMRIDYVAHLRQLFESCQMLLICLEYPQNEMPGPPFNVEENEVSELFKFASINKIYEQDILAKEPKFMQRGLSHFKECAYRISW